MENQTEPKLSAEDMLTREDYKRVVENLLFITDRPLSAAKLSQVAEINNIQLTRDIIAALQQEYIQTSRAIQILEIGGGFQMATKPEYGRWVRKLFNEKMSAKLSAAALETLAIIAYKQPVTRAEIEAIRGVDIVAPLEKIMERGLVKIVGKKDAPGKPMVYGTTDDFLRLFGLNKLSELPELKTFSTKGPREIQSDLPFSESLPEIRENIIPLSEEEILLLNIRPIPNPPGVYTQGSIEEQSLSSDAVVPEPTEIGPEASQSILDSADAIGLEAAQGFVESTDELLPEASGILPQVNTDLISTEVAQDIANSTDAMVSEVNGILQGEKTADIIDKADVSLAVQAGQEIIPEETPQIMTEAEVSPEQDESALIKDAAQDNEHQAAVQTQEEIIPEGMGIDNLKDLNS